MEGVPNEPSFLEENDTLTEDGGDVVDLAEVRAAAEEEGGGVEDSDFSANQMEAAEAEHKEAA